MYDRAGRNRLHGIFRPLDAQGVVLMAEPRIITFGCRLNAYESEVVRQNALAAGLDNAVIVNTCAVTAEAGRQARQSIRRARRDQPTAKIIVTGCAAQLDPETFAQMPEVDQVLGNSEKLDAVNFGIGQTERVRVNDIMSITETAGHMIDGLDGRARAFVQIQNGCDHRCTFCIIPFARGPNRSVPMGAVVDQVRRLVKNGYREVVLTGVDITAYGADLPDAPALGRLVASILNNVPDLDRLRLSSLDPVEVDEVLFGLLADEPRLMPHLHLSLQAGDDMVLKRMKRRHNRGDAIEFCERVRAGRPDAAFGADLIAGFPTESDDMFDDAVQVVLDTGQASISMVQRRLRVGYTRAARLI
ncbi:MAG: tRNA (N(6)-L-threonylcarbamoyladenosine(37)-C(2))-methylthiotransferase MtaB, partial [Rhodospirillales bacterium]|nr:tRNA (N(6)-L-threonylcarbamoyladenosine(37)-C(2))-methylthiotransferase MtaB [Rhodospirillales bacterium]